jgi:hypothetical protein
LKGEGKREHLTHGTERRVSFDPEPCGKKLKINK